jgi:hypothetical protein
MSAGEVHAAASRIPVASARTTLLNAYHVGFSATLNHLMIIATIVAMVGSVGGFGLVRQRDFVAAGGPGAGGHA